MLSTPTDFDVLDDISDTSWIPHGIMIPLLFRGGKMNVSLNLIYILSFTSDQVGLHCQSRSNSKHCERDKNPVRFELLSLSPRLANFQLHATFFFFF